MQKLVYGKDCEEILVPEGYSLVTDPTDVIKKGDKVLGIMNDCWHDIKPEYTKMRIDMFACVIRPGVDESTKDSTIRVRPYDE